MSSEHGAGPDPSEAVKYRSSGYSDALADLADTRLKDRESTTNWGKKAEMRELAEKRYTDSVADPVYERLQKMVEAGHASKEDLIKFIASNIALERTHRDVAEANALTQKMSMEGKGWLAKTVDRFRNDRKLRLGIGIGVTVATGGLAAAGAVPAAIALRIGYTGIRMGAAYLGTREVSDRAMNKIDHRSILGGGKLAGLEDGTKEEMRSQADSMDRDERVALLARLRSTTNRRRTSVEQQEFDDKRIASLHNAEGAALLEALQEKHAGKSRAELLKESPAILRELLTADIKTENLQLTKDKHSLLIRRTIAWAAAAGVGISSMYTAAKEVHHVASLRDSGLSKPIESSINNLDDLHSPDFSNYPDVVTDQFDPHDTAEVVAKKHLKLVKGWDNISTDKQNQIASDFAKKIARSGDHWRFTKNDISVYFH